MILGIDASQANRAERSGTEWYAFHLIDEFKKLLRGRADVRVRLYFRDQPRADLIDNLPKNFEIKILKWPFPYFWGQVRLSWEMIVNPPDVLFCPAHTISIFHPKKTFTTLHDIGFADNPELYDKLSLWYHRFSAWLAVRTAYHIFTISEFSRQRIMEFYNCPMSKISITYLGIDQKYPPARPESIAANYGLGEKKYILFVGRLESKKNILGMVKGFEAARVDCDLVLAGRKIRTDDVDEYLRSRPELRDKVRFLGYVKEADKHELLRDAAIFLFVTFYEGFGLPILEAQASGTPVVTSNTTSNPEIAGKGAILVDPKNIGEIAAAINRLLTNKELGKRKIELGYENIKRFSWEKTARETLWTLLK